MPDVAGGPLGGEPEGVSSSEVSVTRGGWIVVLGEDRLVLRREGLVLLAVGWVLRLGGLWRWGAALGESCVRDGPRACFRRLVGTMEKSTPGASVRLGVVVRLLRRSRGPLGGG